MTWMADLMPPPTSWRPCITACIGCVRKGCCQHSPFLHKWSICGWLGSGRFVAFPHQKKNEVWQVSQLNNQKKSWTIYMPCPLRCNSSGDMSSASAVPIRGIKGCEKVSESQNLYLKLKLYWNQLPLIDFLKASHTLNWSQVCENYFWPLCLLPAVCCLLAAVCLNSAASPPSPEVALSSLHILFLAQPQTSRWEIGSYTNLKIYLEVKLKSYLFLFKKSLYILSCTSSNLSLRGVSHNSRRRNECHKADREY